MERWNISISPPLWFFMSSWNLSFYDSLQPLIPLNLPLYKECSGSFLLIFLLSSFLSAIYNQLFNPSIELSTFVIIIFISRNYVSCFFKSACSIFILLCSLQLYTSLSFISLNIEQCFLICGWYIQCIKWFGVYF